MLCKLINQDRTLTLRNGDTYFCIKFQCHCSGFDEDKAACPLWGEALAAERVAKAAEEYYRKMFEYRD